MSDKIDAVVTEETRKLEEENPIEQTGDTAFKEMLAEYGVNDAIFDRIVNELGAETVEDLAALEANDLVDVGVKLAQARKLVANLKTQALAKVQDPTENRAVQAQFENLLPTVPSDESWLNALKTGGIQKVEDSSIIAAIRAALAEKTGFFEVPKKLADAMEQYSKRIEEPIDPRYFKLKENLTRHNYGDLFNAIPGMNGSYVNETNRKDFVKKVDTLLWPAIVRSYQELNNWYQIWRASFSDPSMLIVALSGGFNLGSNPAGISIIAPPDTTPLHDAGDDLIQTINKVFSGIGVQIAAALAFLANQTKTNLEDPSYPAMVGAPNREQMLKEIGASVSNSYIRLEQNLVKFVLGFIKHTTVTSDIEVNYFVALWQLGSQINWEELGVPGATGGLKGLTGKDIL